MTFVIFSVENLPIVLTFLHRLKQIGFLQGYRAEAPIWIERQKVNHTRICETWNREQ
jgi:hypothetical protein